MGCGDQVRLMDGLRVDPIHSMKNFPDNRSTFHQDSGAALFKKLQLMLANAVFKAAQVCCLNQSMNIRLNLPGGPDTTLCHHLQGR